MRRRNLILVLAALLLAVGVVLFVRMSNERGAITADRAAGTSVAPAAPRTTTVIPAAGVPVLPARPAAVAPADFTDHQFKNTTNALEALVADDRAIILENAWIDTTRPLNFSIPEHLQAAAEPGTYLVQARGYITERFRAALAAGGATILSYIPNNACQVVATAEVARWLATQPEVQAVLPFEPVYKLKAELLGWALEQEPLPEGGRLNLLLTPALQTATRDALLKAGVTIVTEAPSPFGPVLTVTPGADWSSLARLAGVQGMELTRVRIQANDLSRARLGVAADSVTETNYLGLTGTNVLVGLNDTGVSADHPDLTNRIIPWTAAAGTDTNGHGTHIAGIIMGDGTQSLTVTNARGSVNPGTNFQYRGKAPGAKLLVQSLDLDGGGVSDGALQVNAARTNVFISNNSWHYAGAFTYDLAASSFDAAARDALPGVPGSQPQLYVFAAGNSGNGGDDGLGGFARSIPSPGTAKNVITVGALEQARDITNVVTKILGSETNTSTPWADMTSSDQQVAGFSGRGNVGVGIEGTFGRFKPDVVAPGTFVLSTRSTSWDEKFYYNPTSHIRSTERRLVQTNTFDYPFGGIPLPLNAVGFTIRLVPNSNSPVPFPDLPIYVDTADYPTTISYRFIRTNVVSVPPDAPGVIGGETWFYGIRNTTTQAVDFTVITDIVVTNENGDQLTVLSNLNNSISGAAPHYYRYESGTSMSAAEVTGVLALMQQFFQERNITNSPAMMKALLINGARSVDSSVYNFLVRNTINYQGWGLPRLPNSIPTMLLTNGLTAVTNTIFMFDQVPTNALATGQSKTRHFSVSEEARTLPLRVTLVWTDPPGNPAAGLKLVNDLDLIVTNRDTGQIYWGNNFPAGQFTTASTTNSAPSPDLVNNVENVYINADLGTNYSITVAARRVNVNAVTAHTNGVVQDYALVVASGSGEAPDALYLNSALELPIQGTNANLTDVTIITNIFVGDGFSSAGLEGQRVGANSPLLGTLTGTTNQWHFYIITNTSGYTNASFLTSAAKDLSIPRMGVYESSFLNATRTYADVDLYVAPNNPGLTSLDPAAVAGADKSLSRNTVNGDEAVIYSNSVDGVVYYIGVKSEDYQAAEFELWAIFSLLPLGQEDGNGFIRAYPFSPGDGSIPSGPNDLPGVAKWRAFGSGGGDVRRVVITNSLTHQRLDDVISSVVSPAGTAVTLNNHKRLTTPAAPGPYNFLYEDNGEGDFLDSVYPDGPGHLYDYVGEKRDGQWKFFFVDNVLSATGRVDSLRIRLEKQCEDECNMTNTVAPGAWRYFSKNVSVEATNMTVCLNIITPGTPQPLELYIRKNRFPTRTAYDFKKTITPPGGCLSIDKFQLPPLSPGRYFIGVFNPSSSSQTFYVTITVEEGPPPTPFTFNPTGSQPLLDDAVTNYTTLVTDHMPIARVDVGLRIDHPRVSDLAVTLISPHGTRVLLVENRGGTNVSGFGTSLNITNIVPASATGGPEASTNVIPIGVTAGTFTVNYNFYCASDRMIILYDGATIFDTGLTNNGCPADNSVPRQATVAFGPGVSTNIIVVMNPGGNAETNTQWTYTISAINNIHNYLFFTDNTNLTTTPIKFVLPPFTNATTPIATVCFPTNIVVMSSSFENPVLTSSSCGDYNRTGNVDGWQIELGNIDLMRAPCIFNGPTSDTGFQCIDLSGNQVGRIATNFPTTIGDSYTLSFAYSKNPGAGNFVASTMVDFTGTPPFQINYGLTNSRANLNWVHTSMVFTATAPTSTLRLTSLNTSNAAGMFLDSFKIMTIDTVCFTNFANYVLPEESLSAFEGEYADGVWRLEVLDTRTGASNNVSLLDWQLQFIYQTNTAPPRILNPGTPVDVTLPPGQIIYFLVDVPSFARFATNVLFNSDQNLGFYFNQNLPPGFGATNIGDVVFASPTTNHTEVLSLATTPPLLPGQRYYLAFENISPVNASFTVYVDFDLAVFPPFVDLTNGVPYCTVNPFPLQLDYYHFKVSSNAVRAQFEIDNPSGDMTLFLRRELPPSFVTFDYLSASPSTNDEVITVFDFSQPVALTPGDWYFAAANLSSGPVSYCAAAWEWTVYGTNIVITNTFIGTNSFCLTWTSLPGVRYVVEGVTNLTSTNWVAVSPTVTATGPLTTYCVPLPSPYQFFRVREGQTQSTFVPPPYIIRIEKRFNGIAIVWSGPPGQQYKVEWSPTLVPTVWTQFTETITSTTGIYSYLDDGSQTGGFGPTRYYRLVLLP